MSKSAKQLETEFVNFEKYRTSFVRMIAETATRAENIQNLLNNRALYVLHPLLNDDVPAIRESAALAIGRLANYDEVIATDVMNNGILTDIVNGLTLEADAKQPDSVYQRHACFVVRTVSRHSPNLAENCVEAGALPPMVSCLQSCEAKVREAAALSLGAIATHTPELAQAVVDSNVVPLLITSAQSGEASLRRIAIAALGDIAKHNTELANVVIKAKGVQIIVPMLKDLDPRLKAVVCSTLAHIAKHSVESAELIAQADIFPESLLCLKDSDYSVRHAAATLVRELVKHTQELAQRVVNEGGAVALVAYLKPEQGNDPIFGVMAVGYIASFSQSLATVLLQSGAAEVTLNVFVAAKSDQTKAAAAWALGQLGKHTTDTAAALANLNVLSLLLDGRVRDGASPDLVQKTERALELVVAKTTIIEALEPLIEKAHPRAPAVLEVVLEQISKLLPKNKAMRVPFINSGAFAAVQRVNDGTNPAIAKAVEAINACYPDQAVKFYQPNYDETILNEIENFGA